MSDRRNGLEQGVCAEVKKFVKDVIETPSCEYGFILKWNNCSFYAYKDQFENCLCQSKACCG